jgi:hypothetical protein
MPRLLFLRFPNIFGTGGTFSEIHRSFDSHSHSLALAQDDKFCAILCGTMSPTSVTLSEDGTYPTA